MRVILQGSVRHFAASELMALLARPAHSGTFDAESGEKRLRLFFKEGKIAWAEGTTGGDARALVTDFVTWTDGTFTFLDALSLPEGVVATELDPTELVATAEKRIAETQRVLSMYPDEQTVFRVVQTPQSDMISLHPEQLQVLLQISGGRSLAQLRTDTKKAALELYPIVHTLQAAGLIEVAKDFDPDATARPEPPPAPRPKSLSKKKSTGMGHAPAIATLTTAEGLMLPILDDESIVGRVSGSAVTIPDPSVSSKHARVVRTANSFSIEDLGSRNGTFVNGESVTAPRPLADGDVVRFGKVLLTFNIAAETKKQDTTQPEIKVPKKSAPG